MNTPQTNLLVSLHAIGPYKLVDNPRWEVEQCPR